MKKNKGFTLIELMIVVAIIAIIAAIAIPNLLRSRLQSNESATIGNLKAVVGAQTSYNSAKGVYAADWATLTAVQGDAPRFLDGTWDDATAKSGYLLVLQSGDVNSGWDVTATPAVQDQTGVRGFFVDASGVIRFDPAGAATVASQPIGETAVAP